MRENEFVTYCGQCGAVAAVGCSCPSCREIDRLKRKLDEFREALGNCSLSRARAFPHAASPSPEPS